MTRATVQFHDDFHAKFAHLAARLREASTGRRLVFVQNAGNFGDALIRYGTLKFFEDHGFRGDEYDMGSRLAKGRALLAALQSRVWRNRLFVYSGSGAWARACEVGYRNVHRLRTVTRDLFILPTTFEKFDLDPEIPVFARDKFQSLQVVPHAEFCHDMAFYLALIEPERVLDHRRPGRKTGVFLRTDNERRASKQLVPRQSQDLSAMGDHRSDPKEFLRFIDQFGHLVTDRLHVAIGAVILGKSVTLFPGNYFKIEAIYNSSIRGNFDRVELVTDEAQLRAVFKDIEHAADGV